MPFKGYWIEVFLTPYAHNFVYIEWVRYPIESQFYRRRLIMDRSFEYAKMQYEWIIKCLVEDKKIVM